MTDLNTLLTAPGEGEYLAEDGLIHCQACHTPRQVKLDFGDRVMTVRCLCPCQQSRMEQQRQRLRQQEEMDRFARIRSAAMRDPVLRRCTFEASRYNESVMTVARNYVDQWPQMLSAGSGLLFWGNVGTGKTYIAACIANALLDKGVAVLMTSFARMLGAIPGPASGDQTETVDNWMRYPLLIIDDLGIERDTPYVMEQVYHIIDARYRSGKPMIITTNLTVEETSSRYSPQISSRLYGEFKRLTFLGTDIRVLKNGGTML